MSSIESAAGATEPIPQSTTELNSIGRMTRDELLDEIAAGYREVIANQSIDQLRSMVWRKRAIDMAIGNLDK